MRLYKAVDDAGSTYYVVAGCMREAVDVLVDNGCSVLCRVELVADTVLVARKGTW